MNGKKVETTTFKSWVQSTMGLESMPAGAPIG